MKLMVKLTPIFVLVVLVFVCYSLFLYMNRVYEPLDNPPSCLGPVTDENPPSCGSGSGANTRSDVSGCFNTVRADAYNGFLSDFMSSDYILKTQMVTPVCPNNPVGEVGTEYGKNERIITPEDDKGLTKKDAAKTDYDPVTPDETKMYLSYLLGRQFNSEGTSNSSPQETSQEKVKGPGQSQEKVKGPGQETKQATPQATSQVQGSIPEVKNTYMLNAPTPTPTTNVKPETSRGVCPPCPACKRCPEPVVECKRVVNYNAAGASNLPVPMIADFSKF
jgi:hypothetical protein